LDADRHLYRTFACTACGYTFQAPVACGNRFCPVCSSPRRRRAAQKLRALVASITPPFPHTFKHLTLTVPSHPDLNVMHRDLLLGFRRLRQRSLWKRTVRGGAFTLELTGRPGAWHLHLHAILEARYIPWNLLHQGWQKVSPGRGVFIATRPPRVITHYLTGYITKNELSADNQKTASNALKSSRLFCTFGTWHNLTIKLPRRGFDCPICHDDSCYPLDLLNIINRIGYLPRKRHKERASPCQD
jgi:hypothetical protein